MKESEVKNSVSDALTLFENLGEIETTQIGRAHV